MLRPFNIYIFALCAWIAPWIAPAVAAELVMIDRAGCQYCLDWKREIGPAYPNTTEGKFAPLYIMDISDVRRSTLKLQRPVVYTPTFLLVENERELNRLEGYPGEDFFWFHLNQLLTEHTDFKPAKTH